ncbi:hypothetical protein O181_058892 [Austropuccinia psidii MF-1]|uniref:Uncharacterized protein n=1 Tax=Austropuccinia psidii MF-1 TaxID=1389203 RepID=A0A9Q3HWW7_9BASI|nr:hypothetical protein [Austropuccinia psidii MF-1]
MQDSFRYEEQRWDKTHKQPYFTVGDFVIVSTLNLNDLKGPNKLKYSFEEPFMIRSLHGPNAVQIELTGELLNKHQILPVSLIETYSSSHMELIPLISEPPLETPHLEEGEEKENVKFLKERRTRNKKEREDLVRYRNPTQEDEWLLEKYIANEYKLSRRFRH